MASKMTKHGLLLSFSSPGGLPPEVVEKIKTEVLRIGANGTCQGVKFAQKMVKTYPQLRNV